MALSELLVTLHGVVVGKLHFDGQYHFQHGDEPPVMELSRSLPYSKSKVYRGRFRELPNYFAQLLPEGWLKDASQSLKIPVQNDLERLYLTCRDTFGAVSFQLPHGDNPHYLSELGVDKAKIYEKIWHQSAGENASYENRREICYLCGNKLPRFGYNQNFHEECSQDFFGAPHPPLLDVKRPNLFEIAKMQAAAGQTITGVQVKFSLEYKSNDRTLSIPNFAYIVKPESPSESLNGMAACEHILMLLAEECGLNVARSSLTNLRDGVPAYITRRFDREGETKVHAEDFAQVLDIRHKYEGSYKKIAKVLMANSNVSQTDRNEELKQFLNVTIFNYVFGNADAHLKNHAVIRDSEDRLVGGRDRLAPFYDLFPAKLFAPKDTDDLGLALGIDIGGSACTRKDKIGRKEFDAFAEYLGFHSRDITFFLKKIRRQRERLKALLIGYQVPTDVGLRLGSYVAHQLARMEKGK